MKRARRKLPASGQTSGRGGRGKRAAGQKRGNFRGNDTRGASCPLCVGPFFSVDIRLNLYHENFSFEHAFRRSFRRPSLRRDTMPFKGKDADRDAFRVKASNKIAPRRVRRNSK